MKKFYCLLLAAAIIPALSAQSIFTYGNAPVGNDEFMRAYNKNKSPEANKESALREYLNLYINFKLKVKAAQTLRLDTLESLKADVSNFRNQVQESYMNDTKGVAVLVDEAFDRSQKDLHVLHFYVNIDEKMNRDDTTRARKAIEEVYDELKKGTTDYPEMLEEISGKFFPTKGTDLGFITAFLLPYKYENIVYGLKPGGISRPYRSKSGWHVFKLAEERKSAGKWKIAQILLAFPPEGAGFKLEELKNRADSMANLLKKGADFAEMAKEYSQDKLTYLNGGEMPEFGTGRYDLPFETEVFKLSKNGEISNPIQTQFGYHIIKRLGQSPTPVDKNDAGYTYEIKQKVLQDDRIASAQEEFVKEVIKKTGYKRNAAVPDVALFRYADSMTPSKTAADAKKFPISNKVIFSTGKTVVKGSDWLNFVYDYKTTELYKGEASSELLSKYVEAAALEYYKKNLEEYSNEFKYQMQEFTEGNMLFEIMERNVWNRAASDTNGLKKLYAQKKNNYQWPASADVLIFNCGSAKAADAARAALLEGKNWKEIADSSAGNVQADSTRYELTQIPLAEGTAVSAAMVSKPLVNGSDGTAVFVKILNMYPAGMQRSFEEARGLVINDYQAYLEEEWIKELKKKYPVKINEAAFKSLIQ
jgi:peptidyl-prolyl cis-trans isomerase SurA